MRLIITPSYLIVFRHRISCPTMVVNSQHLCLCHRHRCYLFLKINTVTHYTKSGYSNISALTTPWAIKNVRLYFRLSLRLFRLYCHALYEVRL